jgi:Spy/CpxP family protein refolding chaperone
MRKMLGFVLVCLFFIQASAWAADGPGGHFKGPGRRFKGVDKKALVKYYMKLQEALKLTDQQIKELQSRNFAFQKEAVKERAAIQTATIELKEIKAQDQLDVKKAEAKIRQIASLQADMRIARMKHVEDARGVLTVEQKNTLKNLRRKPMMIRTLASDFPPEDIAGLSSDEQDEITFIEDVFEISLVEEPEEQE